jgi:hypothetical protein
MLSVRLKNSLQKMLTKEAPTASPGQTTQALLFIQHVVESDGDPKLAIKICGSATALAHRLLSSSLVWHR